MPTRLLVAQHDRLICLDLSMMLRDLGYQVVAEAGDGQSVVSLARELRPDLVITCIIMPEMDGLTAARILRRERIAPVMLLTALSDKEMIARACDVGVVMYLTKPPRQCDLAPAIEMALARYREMVGLEQRVRQLEEQLAARKVVDCAIGELIEGEHLSYREAWRWLHQISLTRSIPLREAAEALLLEQA